MSLRSFEEYWESGFPEVEGWVDSRLAEYLLLVGAIQRDHGVTGEICEIGVYHGKFLIALAHLAGSGAKVTAIDVFEDQARNLDGAGVGSLEQLQDNIRRYGPNGADFEFIKADSIAMLPHERTRLAATRGPFRLFSVDGCHTAEHTCNDLLTAQDCLAPGGVIILDDVYQPHWPGVTEAVGLMYSRYVPRIKPFLYCFHKLFFVGFGWQRQFFDGCWGQFGSRPDAKVTEMNGSPVVSIYS